MCSALPLRLCFKEHHSTRTCWLSLRLPPGLAILQASYSPSSWIKQQKLLMKSPPQPEQALKNAESCGQDPTVDKKCPNEGGSGSTQIIFIKHICLETSHCFLLDRTACLCPNTPSLLFDEDIFSVCLFWCQNVVSADGSVAASVRAVWL